MQEVEEAEDDARDPVKEAEILALDLLEDGRKRVLGAEPAL